MAESTSHAGDINIDSMAGEKWAMEIERGVSCSDVEKYRGVLTGRTGMFFQSDLWLGAWCRSLGLETKLNIAVLRRNGEIAGLVFFVGVRERRLGVFSLNRARVSETGDHYKDILAIEHNGIICRGEWLGKATQCFLGEMLGEKSEFDEIWLPGIDNQDFREIVASAERTGLACRVYDKKPFYWVNLNSPGAEAGQYIMSLSSNTRYHIRRSMRYYESIGPVVVKEAGGISEAFGFLDRLVELHEAHWLGKGVKSGFVSGFAREFHRDLVQSGLNAENVQLLRIRAGNEDIGYLYNFLSNGVVLCYQSGFNYGLESRAKPGLVCHAEAVEYNRRKGFVKYDFLAGDSQYKRSLSHDTGNMYWVVVQKRSVTQKLESFARTWKHRLEPLFRR